MKDNCVLVFTSRTIEQMVAEGGSAAWVIDAARARTYEYLVCCWNPKGQFAQVNYGRGHGEAFLVAPITTIEPAPGEPGRYILRFAEFARVSVPGVWTGKRNPITYASLSELGIDAASLTFETAAKPSALALPPSTPASSDLSPLPISAAKPRLAAFYNVPVEAIEIIIRG
jgi:hypothetical protein